jgi:hypothetical protein
MTDKYAPKGMSAADALAAGFVLIRCGSHRSGGPAYAQCYYSFRRAAKGGYYAIKPDALPRRGATKLRGPFDDILMCWGA